MSIRCRGDPPQADGSPLLIVLSSNAPGLRLYPTEIILRALHDGQKQHLRYLIAMEFLDTSDYGREEALLSLGNNEGLFVVAYLIPGFNLTTISAGVVTAVVIGVVNTFIRPIVQLIALPISIVTFGLTAFLINVLLLWGVSKVVPGFTINSFTTAILASIVLSLISWFLNKLANE